MPYQVLPSCVLVSGAICSHPGQLAAAGDKIELAYDPHRRYHPLPRPAKHPGFDVLFEDGDLIVVNGQLGLPGAWVLDLTGSTNWGYNATRWTVLFDYGTASLAGGWDEPVAERRTPPGHPGDPLDAVWAYRTRTTS